MEEKLRQNLESIDFDKLVKIVKSGTDNPFFVIELVERLKTKNEKVEELNKEVDRGLDALESGDEE